MLNPITRSFIFMLSLILLAGCETLQLIRTGTAPAPETGTITKSSQSAPATGTGSAASAATESPSQPAPNAQEPTPLKPTASKKPKVAVYDSDDYAQAKAQHLKTLLDNRAAPLELADVGYYMDVQNAQFIQLLQPANIEIKYEGGRIILTLPGSDSFAKNSLKLKSEAELSLAITTQVLAEYTQTLITIHGHTDDLGEADYNQHLSVRRALSVADYLVNAGIAIERIAVIGFGESLPLNLNKTDEGRAQNRRIELYLEPIAR